MVKHLSATLVAVLLLSTTSLTAPNPSRLLDSVTTLQYNGRNACTTTSINQDKAFFLLAAHCFGANATDRLTIDGQSVRIMKLDVARDLAVVMLRGTKRPALKLAKTAPDYLDEVFVAGHPFGWTEPTIFKGLVASPSLQFDDEEGSPFSKPYMILQVAGAPGNSGSSVVNSKMEIVGVVQIGTSKSFSSVMGASPYADLVAFGARYFE